MSAIFGKFCFDERTVSSSDLLPMQQAMAYWGPDGEGIWCKGHVGLGHLHRDNTPESVGDSLPWICPASGDVITASVRLDNRDELLKALSISHPDRASLPDSRLILNAYQRWGEKCADRLLGDWVFAIWNAKERKLFIARDHQGNTGLYYYKDSRCLVFATSLKGLLALSEVPRRPNAFTIAQVLVAWPVQGAPTCHDEILRLPPAHTMTVTPKGIEVKRYWYLEHTPDLHLSTDDEYVDAFLEIFTEAVRSRLRCSAPVGVTLSGGLDSGSVAVAAARELGKRGQRLAAYSSVPIIDTKRLVDSKYFGDETPFIKATAKAAGNIDVNYIKPGGGSPIEGIEKSLIIHDQPLHSAGSTYWLTALMAKAQQQGLGAMLTGQGGNGTISWTGGIEPYLLDYLMRLQWGTFGRKLRAWQTVNKQSLWRTVRSQIIHPMLVYMRQGVQRFKAPTEAWREYSAINVAFARELDLTNQMVQQGHDPTFSPERDAVQVRLKIIRPGGITAGHHWFEIGAAYGLEVRDPTFDPRVMSFCWSIPESQYVQDGQNRMLIRRAMANHLPKKVLWNRRKGVQSADLGHRVVDHASEVGAALDRLKGSELACYYLDLPKMRGVFESLRHGITRENTSQSVSVLLRGLMVGLFLLRFDG